MQSWDSEQEPTPPYWETCGGGYGIHWEALDEDLSTAGMLRGAHSPEARRVFNFA